MMKTDFKFHYVSINSMIQQFIRCAYLPLNSIMFLLIREKTMQYTEEFKSFKFHYVSINSYIIPTLEGDMLLFKFHYVSINSYNPKK